MTTLNLGMVGAGRIGQVHAANLAARCSARAWSPSPTSHSKPHKSSPANTTCRTLTTTLKPSWTTRPSTP